MRLDKRVSMRVQQCVARRDCNRETLAKESCRVHEWERVPDIAKRGEMATRYTDCTRHISGPASLCTTVRDCMYITAAPSSRTRASLCSLHLPTSPFLPLSFSPFLFLLIPSYSGIRHLTKNCQDGWDMLWTLSNLILILLWAVALSRLFRKL